MLDNLNLLLLFSHSPFHPPCHLIHVFAQSGFSRPFLWFHGCHYTFSFENCFYFEKMQQSTVADSTVAALVWVEVLEGTVISFCFSRDSSFYVVLSFIFIKTSVLLQPKYAFVMNNICFSSSKQYSKDLYIRHIFCYRYICEVFVSIDDLGRDCSCHFIMWPLRIKYISYNNRYRVIHSP